MLRKISKVSGNNLEELRNWCRDKVSLMTSDVSRYGRGRKRLWLFNEVNLANGDVKAGYSDERIRRFSQRVYPGCEIGLLTFGGKVNGISSTGLIGKHRDHAYGSPTAVLVNLGSCIFGYGDQQYQLEDGDIIEFNCKEIHSVEQILSPERFSLVFWKFSPKFKNDWCQRFDIDPTLKGLSFSEGIISMSGSDGWEPFRCELPVCQNGDPIDKGVYQTTFCDEFEVKQIYRYITKRVVHKFSITGISEYGEDEIEVNEFVKRIR
jgi:hypothetical protein